MRPLLPITLRALNAPPQMLAICPWHGETTAGDLLTFTHIGSLDVSMCLRVMSRDQYIAANVAVLEFLMWSCDTITLRTGRCAVPQDGTK